MSDAARRRILFAFLALELGAMLLLGALEGDKAAERERLADKLRAGDELTEEERAAAADLLHDDD